MVMGFNRMKKINLGDFVQGWVVGNFEPSLFKNEAVEVCIKNFKKGDVERAHYQEVAHELTVVVTGECRMGDVFLGPSDGLVIPPGVVADFEALTDCSVVGVKWPSISSDKVEV